MQLTIDLNNKIQVQEATKLLAILHMSDIDAPLENGHIKAAPKKTAKKEEETFDLDAATTEMSEEVPEADFLDDAQDEKPAVKTAPKKKEEKITEAQILKALQAYVKINGKDKALKCLKKFGAKGVRELKEKDYPKFMVEIC